MELAEFDVLAGQLRLRSATSIASSGFALIDGRTATAAQLGAAEKALGVTLPDKYKAFMTGYGAGVFGFVDLIPVATTTDDDLVTINDAEFPDRTFIAIAPVGTGDYWGFPVTDDRCHDEVWFRFHDAGEPELAAADFLEFLARYAWGP